MSNILFINSVQKNCGVHDYGERTFRILENSVPYNFIYKEPNNLEEYNALKEGIKPEAVIHNYHPLTMAWLPPFEPTSTVRNFMLHHEGTELNLKPDYWLYVDSLHSETGNKFAIPRPLLEGIKEIIECDTYEGNGKFIRHRIVGNEVNLTPKKNIIPVISSFGFGFGNKNYGLITKMVNEQFDEAILRLHIPRAYYGDRSGEATAGVLPGIQNEMKNPNIKLEITHDFLPDIKLLYWLSESSLNVFLYEQMEGRGLSSVIDYALSVDVPIAINDSAMFRHIQNPISNVANNSLKDIIAAGTDHLKVYKQKWSNDNFLRKYESILNETL